MPPPKEIIRMGVGYDSVLDRSTTEVITPLEVVSTSGDAGGSNAVYFADVIKSYRELLSICDISASATFKLGTLKGEVKTRFFESLKFNSKSIYLFAECMVRNPSKELSRPMLSSEAIALAKEDVGQFQKKYGDEFVYKHNRGGSIKVLYEFVNIRSERKKIVNAQIDVAKKFVNAGFKVTAKLKNSLKEIEDDTRVRLYYFRNGDFEKIPGLTFAALDKEARAFVNAIKPDSGKDVVLSVESQPYIFAVNSPKELSDLAALADKGRDYVQALFAKACECQERIGDCRATLDNAEEYSLQDVELAKSILPKLEKQGQMVSDIYDNYVAKRVMTPALKDVQGIVIEAYESPQPVEGPFATGFRFGKNALDCKIYLGELVSSEDFTLKVDGALRFMGDPPLANTWVYGSNRWVTAWVRDIYQSRMTDPRGDDLRPVVFYFHDLITDDLTTTEHYDRSDGKLIKGGRYKVYVTINTKAQLYTINTVFNTRPVMYEGSVITLDEGAEFRVSFAKVKPKE